MKRLSPLTGRPALLLAGGLVCLSGFLMQPGQAVAQETADPSFADVLHDEGDYFRAITEYRRAIHEADDEETKQVLWFRIGQCYLAAQRYTEAMNVFGRLAQQEIESPLCLRSRYQMGLTYLNAGTTGLARKEFLALLELPPDNVAVGGDRLTLALAATWFQERNWEKAAASLDGFEQNHKASPLLETATFVRAQSLAAEDVPRKSPFLAGLLSAVIPGLGQFYEGRWGDGVQALLITGVFGAATVASLYVEYHNNYSDYVVPSLIGSGFVVFYGANIYGAVNGARMSNTMAIHRHVADVRVRYLPVLR